MTAKKPKSQLKKAGRPTVFTLDVIRKIEEIASLDGSVEEMASFAGIHRDSIYAKLKDDSKFSDRIADLREGCILKIRRAAVKHAENSYGNAIDYLARKRKKEFSLRTELTGAEGKDLPQPIMALPSHVPPDHSN